MRDVRTTVPVFIAAVSTAVIESILLAFLIAGIFGWPPVLIAHSVVCFLLALWSRNIALEHADLSRPALLVLTTVFFGPAGSAATALVLGIAAWNMRSATPFEEWYKALFPELEEDPQLLVWEQVIRDQEKGDDSMVPAFADVLAFGTVAQKQALIALVNRRFRPELGPVLKQALSDADNPIRVQAATAISRLETEFLQKTLELSAQLAAAPQNTVVLLELARLHDEFAFAGILDPRRQAETRELALTYYRQYLKLKPQDTAVTLTVARQELRLEKYAAALSLIETAGEDGWSDQSVFWRIECLCGLARFGEARALARNHESRLLNSSRLSLEAAEAVRLWCGQEAA